MAEFNLEELRAQIDERVTELDRAEKHLKKPSTVSFAERRDLSHQATKAADELREHRTALEGKSDGEEGVAALVTEAQAALDRADGKLGAIRAAQPAGLKRGASGGQGFPASSAAAAGASLSAPRCARAVE